MTVRTRTFRKHRGPCGQPAVLGEIGRFRPVPPHAGHFRRMNATPSDLPFKSTGFATYPDPPQLGQSSGSTPLPLIVESIFYETGGKSTEDSFALRNPNKMKSVPGAKKWDESQPFLLGMTTRPGCATLFTCWCCNCWKPFSLWLR